jgi:hypothetical protein
MPVAAPNQTRIRILSSILQLKQFTVAELCLHAGLERNQVYRELAELQKEKVLRSDSVRTEGVDAPRHRPSKRYELTSDQTVLNDIESDVADFFPEADPNSNRHLKRARAALDSLNYEFLAISFDSLDGENFNLWQGDFESRFTEVKSSLELASWESEIDFSEGDHAKHPIVQTLRSYEALRARFEQQVQEEQSRRKRAALLSNWTIVVSALLPLVSPMATTAAAFVGRKLLDDVIKPSNIATVLVDALRKMSERDPQPVSEVLLEDLEPYINSLKLDFREANTKEHVLAALSKNWISYGNKIDAAWRCTRLLAAASQDYRMIFNEANLAQLAHESARAYDAWAKYLELRKPRTNTAEQTLIARIDGSDWSGDAYQEAVRIISNECDASVSAFSETPFERQEEYALEPKLYNPMYEETGREAPLIPVADPLARSMRLHVLTAEATKPVMVGLPVVARAGLFHSRVSQLEAWKLATEAPGDERIVRVDFFDHFGPSTRFRAEDILKSNLHAHVVG